MSGLVDTEYRLCFLVACFSVFVVGMEIERSSVTQSGLLQTARGIREACASQYEDEGILLEVLCKTAVRILELLQDPVIGWDYNQERSTELSVLVNVFFPRYGFDIPWKVSYENLSTYRKLILFGLRPIIVESSDAFLVNQLALNRERWLTGTWTPILPILNNMDVPIPSLSAIDELLAQMSGLQVSTPSSSI